MEHIHLFNTISDFNSVYYSDNYKEPWVSYTIENKKMHYNYSHLDTNGYEYVDLGLPSGTLWATCNVGASTPEGSGGYYAWGEVTEKTGNNAYTWNDYAFGSVNYYEMTNKGMTKYNNTDHKVLLDKSDDVAHIVMGGDWSLPTRAHLQELWGLTRTWKTVNSVYGIELTGTNGNVLFIPATGYISNGSVSGVGSNLYIPSSTINITKIYNCMCLVYGSSNGIKSNERFIGVQCRGVITPKKPSNIFNGHDWVDLGLSSGTLWATCNIGATNPEDYGWYYAWGETSEKTGINAYTWDDYAWGTSYSNITKYNLTDGKIVLDLEDDVAHVIMGGNWLLPTKEQIYELYESTLIAWKTVNGVAGNEFTGSNGNTLFIPAAGHKYNGSLYDAGELGCLWSSNLHTEEVSYGANMTFDNHDDIWVGYDTREYGFPCRGVINP